MARTPKKPRRVDTLTHGGARRRNVPTAEAQPLMADEDKAPVPLVYERRNRDLDPQLVWRGKDEQDEAGLIVHAPPLYIQEKVHPKVLIDDLLRDSRRRGGGAAEDAPDLFADFNGLPEGAARTEYYRHDANWSNRMILGDALQVMGSLAEREGLRGKVQCIYVDPPYGIRFNSNFQWSTTSRDVKDGNARHITREPEQVKAFRDTWRDGIHSYLTYLRDRLTVARGLLAESGSVFVQIGDENVHRVRAVMDEVFGEENFVVTIKFSKTSGLGGKFLDETFDYLIWFAKDIEKIKFRRLFHQRIMGEPGATQYNFSRRDDGSFDTLKDDPEGRPFAHGDMTAQTGNDTTIFSFQLNGITIAAPTKGGWKSNLSGIERLKKADRIIRIGNTPRYVRYFDDAPYFPMGSGWLDTGISGFGVEKTYVVQTLPKVIERCLLMTTDPGDLVLDPTCGSGTTAYVAEQWGRRWITVDTSRVALALARARIMGARYPWYLLADSPEGQRKEAEVTRRAPAETPTGGDVRQGFVYERVPHVTLKSIANNAEIDAIWEAWQETLEPLRERLESVVSGRSSVAGGGEDDRPPATGNRLLQEHQIPRERPDGWPPETGALLAEWWEARIARQKEIDAAIAARADVEYLYDRPYADNARVRVAGPFTVESLAPHRMLAVDEDGEVFRHLADGRLGYGEAPDFAAMILEHLATAGVQQAHREDRIAFSSLAPWPGAYVCAEGRYVEGGGKGDGKDDGEGGIERRAGVFIGPEFGTVARPDLVAAAREAAEAGFDVLVACAFSYEAHATEFEKLGRVPVLKARMNADLHMAGDLKNTGKGNLFVVFGEPDIEVASGRWLVAGNGKMIANYEHAKELSGLGSLEEINGAGGRGLSDLCRMAAAGEVRFDRSGAPRGGVHPGEHRGGSGAARNTGVSSVSGDSERLSGGSGDPSDSRPEAGDVSARTDFAASGAGRGDRADAQRSQALAAIEALHDDDFPLSLTTGHWSQVTIRGVDVFHPNTGEVRSDGPEGIACWFVDTDYDEESFFVRHAYFLGANDPYKALKTTLKAEIDPDAWATLNSDVSRPFPRPASGRIAVKVINQNVENSDITP